MIYFAEKILGKLAIVTRFSSTRSFFNNNAELVDFLTARHFQFNIYIFCCW